MERLGEHGVGPEEEHPRHLVGDDAALDGGADDDRAAEEDAGAGVEHDAPARRAGARAGPGRRRPATAAAGGSRSPRTPRAGMPTNASTPPVPADDEEPPLPARQVERRASDRPRPGRPPGTATITTVLPSARRRRPGSGAGRAGRRWRRCRRRRGRPGARRSAAGTSPARAGRRRPTPGTPIVRSRASSGANDHAERPRAAPIAARATPSTPPATCSAPGLVVAVEQVDEGRHEHGRQRAGRQQLEQHVRHRVGRLEGVAEERRAEHGGDHQHPHEPERPRGEGDRPHPCRCPTGRRRPGCGSPVLRGHQRRRQQRLGVVAEAVVAGLALAAVGDGEHRGDQTGEQLEVVDGACCGRAGPRRRGTGRSNCGPGSSASAGPVGWAATTTGGGVVGLDRVGARPCARAPASRKSSSGTAASRRWTRRRPASPAAGTRVKSRRRRPAGLELEEARPPRAASRSGGTGTTCGCEPVPSRHGRAEVAEERAHLPGDGDAQLLGVGRRAGRGCTRRSSISPWSSRANRSVTRSDAGRLGAGRPPAPTSVASTRSSSTPGVGEDEHRDARRARRRRADRASARSGPRRSRWRSSTWWRSSLLAASRSSFCCSISLRFCSSAPTVACSMKEAPRARPMPEREEDRGDRDDVVAEVDHRGGLR